MWPLLYNDWEIRENDSISQQTFQSCHDCLIMDPVLNQRCPRGGYNKWWPRISACLSLTRWSNLHRKDPCSNKFADEVEPSIPLAWGCPTNSKCPLRQQASIHVDHLLGAVHYDQLVVHICETVKEESIVNMIESIKIAGSTCCCQAPEKTPP